MKKYSMLLGAVFLNLLNIYGVLISSLFTPASAALLVIAIACLTLVTTIELRKRRVLL